MNTNPINLLVRFLLEMMMLIVLGCWGWRLDDSLPRLIAAIGLPLLAAVLWGIFRIPNDPKPAPVAIAGPIRLLFELGLFGFAAWALFDMYYLRAGMAMAVIIIIHYIVSYDRTWAMIRNKPYNGFIKPKPDNGRY